MILLPMLAFGLFYLIFRQAEPHRRVAFLAAAVAWGVCVEVITETLSLFRLINRGTLAAFWLVVCTAGLVVYRRASGKPGDARTVGETAKDRRPWPLLVGIAVIVALVGITALAAPPMTWDAMEYHLPRVNLWMSAHSVAFFATPDYRQIVFGPWAEFAMMHLHLLWGSDRLVNLVEWFCLIGCGAGASLLAKLLGARIHGQALAAVASATIPEGILEASGPMNTYVATFWMLTAVVFLLLWNERSSLRNTLCIGLAAGLALNTKGTSYVLLPCLVLAAWLAGSAASRWRFVKWSICFILPLLALCTPQYARNYEFARTPLGVPTPDHYGELEVGMPKISAARTAANMIRNLSNHAGLRGGINDRLDAAFRGAVRLIGQDPDDPAAIWGGTFHVNPLSNNEIVAGNPLHLLLVAGALLYVFLHARNPQLRKALWMSLGLLGAFVLLSAALRWQVWSSRYHLPLFVVGAGVAGVALESGLQKRYASAVALLLLITGCAYAAANRSRSLVPVEAFTSVYAPREALYFSDQHQAIAAQQIALAKEITNSGCKDVAIDSYTPHEMADILHSEASWYVYPLFAMLRADGQHRRIWYTGVHNLTTRYEKRAPIGTECATICLQCRTHAGKWAEYSAGTTRTVALGDDVVFYRQNKQN